ncbi:MAG: flagellar motor protein MotB [Alcanivorax sp.]|jgi:chemotaxis protein MotB
MENLNPHQHIIVRRYKKVKHEEHGGAWKVAMADFALAMMALFLVLWVINSSNEQEREAISGYFQDPKAFEEGKKVPSKYVIDLGGSPSVSDNIAVSETLDPDKILQADEIESLADAIEQRRMEEMKAKIEAVITASPTLSPFKNQLLLDITTEGLRLQIVDQTNRPMFDPGSAQLKYYSEDILWELAPMLSELDHRLQITGHTDSSVVNGLREEDDVNWGLSSSRADSARRALMEAGISKAKIAQVIGMGDTAPLKPEDPGASVNRRISITLLNKKLDEGIKGRTGSDANIDFINVDGAAGEKDARTPVINDSGSLLERLRQQRESQKNTYDNPPNKDEIFW